MPDPVLLRVAPDLLLALSKHAGNAWKEADVLLVRGTDGLAPVERAARAFRDEGPEFWEPFLTYCLSLDPTLGRIRPLAIIPVAGGRLVRADDGVFLPLPSGGSQASEDPEDEDVPQDIIAELPPDLAGRLNTVDTTCLRIRQPNSREFTEFGGKISPISSTGLIRRTRLFELVNNAVIPAIDRLGTRDEDLTLGLRLLKLAARLMHRMKDKSRRRVADDKLKVPTADPTYPEGWSWAPAIECYFGEGWLGGRHGELLHHVYGARKCALLAPWEKVALHVLPDPREEWTKIFRDLGVKARPRILSKAAADFRPPLRLQGRKLVVEPDARCPIQGGEPYWQGYLNSYRDRPTNVLSNGYQYTFDHLTWIDGLDEEHAAATVELMLGEPGMYSTDAALTCRSDRADRPGTDVSASPLPNLWVHALRTEDWASIPADNGAAFCPSECWILRVPQSAPRPKRYESLRCVPAKWLGGEPILSAIGVEDISDPATIDAVARELDRLARHARANPERTGRNLAILAEDLYERLQRRIGNDDPKAGRPKAITMLPLLRAGCLVGVPIAEITGAYYPDDPERAAFVPDFAGKLQWPFSRRRGIAGVTRALRRWLGGRVEAVCLTSEATIETGFQAAGEPMVFMDWLREKFSEDHRQIRTDFGCLIAYAGLRETNPDKTTFQKHWSAFERATLVTGEFRHHPETRVFIQTAGIGQVEFQVAESLSPTETLAELWRVVEASYEDAWRLYCARLGDGAAAAAAFLRSKGIHEREREEVEEAIQVGTGSRFDKIRAATHAILAAGGRLGSKEDFAANWELRSKTTSLLTDWLGNDLTSERIEKALASPEEEGASREVLAHARVSIATWQNSLEALNEPRYRFQSTLQSWEQTRTQLVCTLKVALARQTDTDLSAGEIFLRKLDVLAAPTGVLESPPHLPTIRAVLLDAAERCDLEALGNRPSDFVRRCLATLREASVVAAEEWTTPKDVPDRDVREYRQGLERERIRQATERCRLYVEIAAELAPEQGENLDAATFTSVGKLPRLLDAFWANRFSFMPEFRRELQIRAPLTDGRMQSKGAFSTQLTPHEVRGLFFPPPGPGETESAPRRKLSAVGVDFDETDLLRQLRKDGPLGLAVAAAAQQPGVDLTWLGGDRESLPATTRRPESDGRTRTRTRSGAIRESEADRDLNGKIGEIFVYEWLKALNLPDFDPECWISTNRCAYGGYPDGNDSAGYDFRIVDTDGRLSSRKGTHCLLEVKATSGDGSDPFKISENEWQQARDAHHSKGDQQYLIVRVAYVRMKAPQIVDILRDPYELMIQQKLRIFGTDLTAQAGRRI